MGSNKWYYHSLYFSFLFIDSETTTWPANIGRQISVQLQIIFCSRITETTLLCENGRSFPQAAREWFSISCWSKEQWLNDKTFLILTSVVVNTVIYQCLADQLVSASAFSFAWQITDLLTTDKSRYSAQCYSVIANNIYWLLSLTSCEHRPDTTSIDHESSIIINNSNRDTMVLRNPEYVIWGFD